MLRDEGVLAEVAEGLAGLRAPRRPHLGEPNAASAPHGTREANVGLTRCPVRPPGLLWGLLTCPKPSSPGVSHILGFIPF